MSNFSVSRQLRSLPLPPIFAREWLASAPILTLSCGNYGLFLLPQTINPELYFVANPEKASAPHADALRRAGANYVAG
jgi:hypothetical protein